MNELGKVSLVYNNSILNHLKKNLTVFIKKQDNIKGSKMLVYKC